MTDVLQRMQSAGILSSLDVQLARTLGRLHPGQSEAVLLGAAFASRAIAHGHICADLRERHLRKLLDDSGEEVKDLRLPTLFEWVMELGQTPLCSDGSRPTPLVFDGEARLYLTRYWAYQETLARTLRARATEQLPLDAGRLGADVRRLFQHGETPPDPRQMLAAVVAAARRLTVITGGPGTGKTTTVVRVLALLVEQALSRAEPPPRIMMLAPTGKAAARLTESMKAGLDTLPTSDAVKEALGGEASTVHRALGYLPRTPTQFRHDSSDPLPADIVLVDEASMVDLALMAKLADATPPEARLILLGDKDQLASVEAGAILGDICNTQGTHAYSESFGALLQQVMGEHADQLPLGGPPRTGPWDCIVELTTTFRFKSDAGVGKLARALRDGRADDAVALLASGSKGVGLTVLRDGDSLQKVLAPTLRSAFEGFLAAPDAAAKLERLGDYRLLTALRRGPFGSEHLNTLIEDILLHAGLIERGASGPNYHGRPIMITANDHQMKLYNGDVGVIARDGKRLRAFFRGPDGLRPPLLPSRLPPHETVFAMTVHKSQGSEFTNVGLLLPPAHTALLTRELIYTGVTRAKESVQLYGTEDVLQRSVQERVERASGLRDALWAR
jgi:exodeoxyribonuclease V alpha subunit